MKKTKIKKVTKKFIHEIGFSKNPKKVITDFGFRKSNTISRHEINPKIFYFKILLFFLMSILSFFSLFSLAYFLYCKMKYEKSYIDNKRIIFVGNITTVYQSFIFGYIPFLFITTVLAYLSPYILELLTFENEKINNLIITLINSLPSILFMTLVVNRFYIWQHKNLRFINKLDINSYYEMHIIMTAIHSILRKLALLFTIGLGFPFVLKIKKSYMVNREFLSGTKLAFDGSIISAYFWFLIRILFIALTFGLYIPVFLYN